MVRWIVEGVGRWLFDVALTSEAPKWPGEAIHLCMSGLRLPTHGRYAACLSCGIGGTGIAEPSTPEKGLVANKKHLELGCGVPVVAEEVALGISV